MRVIAGENKGRKLDTPYGKSVRPTSDKVKEAIFSILTLDIYDALVLDLFSGSGSLGIEALSRGASHVYFADNSKESIRSIISNIEKCSYEEKSTVLLSDYKNIAKRITNPVDLVLADPPYNEISHKKILNSLVDIVKVGGILVIEHAKGINPTTDNPHYEFIKGKVYGQTALSIYKRCNIE